MLGSDNEPAGSGAARLSLQGFKGVHPRLLGWHYTLQYIL
uniref:Uncharacterized protein n=1 Tax=Rhizophora mucronata TaxID=61149 RepID=A0A2P2NRL0_RHIMU